MERNRYKISYGPPLAVKDQPHRELDTAKGVLDRYEPEQDANVSELEASASVEFLEVSIEEVIPSSE